MDIQLFHMNLIIAVLISVQGISYSTVIEVGEGTAVTITCPLNVHYPTWTGPEGLASPINNGQTINEPGITWINDKDLKINKTMLKHDGNYTCTDDGSNSRTVQVDVQYFHMWGSFTTATVNNSTTTLTCTCHSNPTCKIVPHIKTNIRDVQDNHDSSTTFNKCESDPHRENRTQCSVVSVMHVYKEDNGLEMSCTYQYKNITEYATLFPKVKVLFPPTRVNVTAEEMDSMLFVTCSTDSSNPVSSLTWRRGVRPKPSLNRLITSNYNAVVRDADYNGKNITQSIDIDPKDIVNGEKIFCCARHQSQNICDSMSLNPFLISSGKVYKYSIATIVTGIVLLLA